MQVDTATSAEQAKQLFQENTYDLLTLDCFMPGTSGVSLHQTLSKTYGFGKRLPSTLPQRLPPILVITGYAHQPSVRDLAFGERVVGILQKPIRSEELLRVVTEVFEWEEVRKSRRSKALNRLKGRVTKKVDPPEKKE
jgi:CheY-like chemotaxis protein